MQWVLRFADLLEEGLIKCIADVHARGDQLIKYWLDVRNDPTVFCFFEHLWASHYGDSLSEGFTSGLGSSTRRVVPYSLARIMASRSPAWSVEGS
jgi:hypothetical protein